MATQLSDWFDKSFMPIVILNYAANRRDRFAILAPLVFVCVALDAIHKETALGYLRLRLISLI